MKANEYVERVEEGTNRRLALSRKKSQDYAKVGDPTQEEDYLSNFKKVAAICNALEVDGCTTYTPSGIATILIQVKQVRDANLKNSKKQVQNESRMDTFDDHHNYLDLKMACEVDEQRAREPVKEEGNGTS